MSVYVCNFALLLCCIAVGMGDIITGGTLLGVYGSHAPVYDDL